MPADREDEICGKALELLSDLCSRGEVHDKNCLDFTYYFRDLGRPRYSDSGKEIVLFLSSNLVLFNVLCIVTNQITFKQSRSTALKLHTSLKLVVMHFQPFFTCKKVNRNVLI